MRYFTVFRLWLAALPLLVFLGCQSHSPGVVSVKPPANLHQWLAQPAARRPALTDCPFANAPLSREQAAATLTALWTDRVKFLRRDRAAEMQAHELDLDGQKMKFVWMSFGDTNAIPAGGRSLFISLHGGGGAPQPVNDEQWTNQIRLGQAYQPAEGIYVAPRAPTDAWDMWHQAPEDDFFARMIEDFVVFEHVNPNRVYVMGYSAGGDGVYQLAPRMADRWAAAAMMAGHPNDASPLSLRNVPFALQVGAEDAAYHRNAVAAKWGEMLDSLRQADPQGYRHFTKIYPGKGHWMDLEDRQAVPWMERSTRRPLPDKVVWYQNSVTHTRSYWLERPAAEVAAGQKLVAQRAGQVITLTSANVNTVTVLLNDAMLDLDRPVVITSNGQILFSNLVSRTAANLARTLDGYGDTNLAFSAVVTVNVPRPYWWSDAAQAAVEAAGPNGAELEKALKTVPVEQRPEMQFLVENMPQTDRENLTAAFLLTNTAAARMELDAAPWGKQIPPGVYLNDLLPYALLTENREDWRGPLRELCLPLVKGCATPGAVALALNQTLYDTAKVHFSVKRYKADQSPLESMARTTASCTGLSILLADACRSLGVPARVVGTPSWVKLEGNHTWVEIWDTTDSAWHFLGAQDPDPAGLDHGWFADNAADAIANQYEHAIYASSFKPTGTNFPMAWAAGVKWVNALNVTARYAKKTEPAAGTVRLLVVVRDASGTRVPAQVTVSDPDHPAQTCQRTSHDESADANDYLIFDWPAGTRCAVKVDYKGQTQQQIVTAGSGGIQIVAIKL